MTGDEDARAELLRQFEAVTSGAELTDLRQIAAELLDSTPEDAAPEVVTSEVVTPAADHSNAAEPTDGPNAGIDPRLVQLVRSLRGSGHGDDLEKLMLILLSETTRPSHNKLVAALAPVQWFLDRASAGGIPLTGAGYLKPADVEAACEVLPSMRGGWGKKNREVHARPVLWLRGELQAMGLLRKQKNTILLTRAGTVAQRDPEALWQHLSERLIPDKLGDFETAATLVALAYAGATPDGPLPLEQVVATLHALGWRHEDATPIEIYELYQLGIRSTLESLNPRPNHGLAGFWISAEAAALARAVLRHPR